jgi:adenosine/AMP kinase
MVAWQLKVAVMAYPINVLPAIRQVPEVCGIYRRHGQPRRGGARRDGHGTRDPRRRRRDRPTGIESESDVAAREALVRRLGHEL